MQWLIGRQVSFELAGKGMLGSNIHNKGEVTHADKVVCRILCDGGTPISAPWGPSVI